MKPSSVQYFIGYGFKVCTRGGAIGLAAFIGWYCGVASVRSVVAIVAALPLGWLAGALVMWPLFLAVGSRINGAPWSEGDLVHILLGQHRGHVGRIYETWPSRNQVRVEISEQATKEVTDVYFDNEICRDRASTDALTHCCK